MEGLEKLQVVEKAIRKALPRLMELSQGCKLEKDGHYYTYLGKFMVNISPYTDGYYLHHFSSEEVVVPKKGKDFFIHQAGDKKFKHYNIVGHDITISDVLEWLGKLNENNYDEDIVPTFNAKGYGVYARCYAGEAFLRESDKLFDFSKPCLADQSEELIDYLYNLIKE